MRMHFWGGVVSVLWCASLINDLTNTPSLVSITVSLLREPLITELAFERLSAEMCSNVVFDVGKLCERFRAFEAPKASVHALSYRVLCIESFPLLGLFCDHFWFVRLSGRINDIICFGLLIWFDKPAFQALLIMAYQVNRSRFKSIGSHRNLLCWSINTSAFFIWSLLSCLILLEKRRWWLWRNFLSQWLLDLHLAQTLKHCVVAQLVKGFVLLKLLLKVRVDRWRSSLNRSGFDMILLFLGGWLSHASRPVILGAFSFLIEGLELVDSP